MWRKVWGWKEENPQEGMRSVLDYEQKNVTIILSIGVNRAQGSCLSNQQMYSFNV